MALNFRLQKVDADDPAVWARIVAMDAKCFEKGFAPALSSNDGAWWIATVDGMDAGYCGIKEHEPGVAYLCRAGVIPRFRGGGLQKLMIRRRLAWARKEGFKSVVSDTCDSPASANSLIACGFRMFSPAKPWSFEYACYWRLLLLPKTK